MVETTSKGEGSSSVSRPAEAGDLERVLRGRAEPPAGPLIRSPTSDTGRRSPARLVEPAWRAAAPPYHRGRAPPHDDRAARRPAARAAPRRSPATPTRRRDGKIYAGVSDTGRKRDYRAFTDLVGTHVAVLQSFQTWGSWQEDHRQAWKRTETRGMLSISTTGSYEGAEVISPRQIRRGRGDGYLMRVGRELDAWDRPTYIRLLPEMNGHWNPYCAFNEDGSKRDAAHSTAQFRKAWIRSVLIIRGGPQEQDQPQAAPGRDAADPQDRAPAQPPGHAEGLVPLGAADPRLAQHPGERAAALLPGPPLRGLDRRRHLRVVPELRRPRSTSTATSAASRS